MPIYEYQCNSCGHISEVLQKMSDPPLNKCPECEGKVSKLMSMNTFHLKGTGWYVTDYAGKGAKYDHKSKKTKKSSDSETKAETTKESSSKKEE